MKDITLLYEETKRTEKGNSSLYSKKFCSLISTLNYSSLVNFIALQITRLSFNL